MDANELLQMAAIVGREFAYDILTLLGERGEDELLRLIEERIDARVIEEMPQPGRYRFTDALMQETLLSELSTTRRVRLHGQVGEALEKRWGGRADERAPRLAEHFLESSTLTPRHARRAVHYAKLAAGQAEAQTAWGEAVRWYEKALTLVTAADDRLGENEADLQLRLGYCYNHDYQFRAAWRALMRALTLFTLAGDGEGAAEAVLGTQNMGLTVERRRALAGQALDVLNDSSPVLRARLLLYAIGDDYSEPAAAMEGKATALAAGQDWPEIEAMLLMRSCTRAFALMQFDEVRRLAAAATAKYESAKVRGTRNILSTSIFPHAQMHSSLIVEGRLEEGLQRLQRHMTLVRDQHLRFGEANTLSLEASIRLLMCEFERLDELSGELSDFPWLRQDTFFFQQRLEDGAERWMRFRSDQALVIQVHPARRRTPSSVDRGN